MYTESEIREALEALKRGDELTARIVEILRYVNNQKHADIEGKAQADSIVRSLFDTDLVNAERFVRQHKADLRFTPERGWLCWDGKRWKYDDLAPEERAMRTAKSIFGELVNASREDYEHLFRWAKRSQSKERLLSMPRLAKAMPELRASLLEYDRDGWLLNCQNGTLDLRTGKLKEHDRADLITRISGTQFDPDAECPQWDAFLHRVMDGDEQEIEFLRRAAGYSLTGDIGEQKLLFAYGMGANGKSVFLESVRQVLGEYAISASADTFMDKRNRQGPRNDLAKMVNARYVATSEVSEGQYWDEPLVKDATGGDPIPCRFLYKEEFEYHPKFKLWVRGNHKPRVKGTDDGIWRRIILVLFGVQIPEPERVPITVMLERFKDEAPGILNWALEGCLRWQEDGLRPPESFSMATEDYREEQDTIGAFIADCCVLDPRAKLTPTELYQAYHGWCTTHGERPKTQTAFGNAMRGRKGITRGKGRERRLYVGIGVASEYSQNEYPEAQKNAVDDSVTGGDGFGAVSKSSLYSPLCNSVLKTPKTRHHPSPTQPPTQLEPFESDPPDPPPRRLKAYEYLLKGNPKHWLTMLQRTGDGLEDARRWIESKHGAENVLDVREAEGAS